MSKTNMTYNRISRYLKGLLSGRERYDLEKEVMQDVFDEEAFDGLNQLNSEELDADMSVLINKLNYRTKSVKKRSRLIVMYRIAAGLVLLIGLGTVLYISFKPQEPELISQDLKRNPPPETAVPSIPSPIAKEMDTSPIESHAKTIRPESADQKSEIIHDAAADADRTDEGGKYFSETIAIAEISLEAEEPVTIEAEEPVTVNAPLQNDKDAELQDSMFALNEVVVVGYGNKKRLRAESSAAEMRETQKAASHALDKYIKPVPPGGSLKTFKDWVESRINKTLFMDLQTGNYRIELTMLVNPDGTVSDITVKNNVPAVITDEYKRAVSQSQPWQPALKDNVPIESEIKINFSLTVE